MDYLSFYAETAIHVGVGQEMGPVDLPIHRERHTGIPFVPGHGLKGALRSLAEVTLGTEDPFRRIFGPAPGSDDLRQGDLVVHEALPLAIPFRSLDCVFVRATCPLLLARFASRTGIDITSWIANITAGLPRPGMVVLPADHQGQQVAQRAEQVVIEDLLFDIEPGGHSIDLSAVSAAAQPLKVARGGVGQCAVLSDTDFVHLVTHRLPVVARVQLTAAKTTGKWKDESVEESSGNLWAEEVLPADTILYAPIGATRRSEPKHTNGKQAQAPETPAAYLDRLLAKGMERVSTNDRSKTSPRAPIQLGGNETVGLGWCWMGLHRRDLAMGGTAAGKAGEERRS